MFVRSDFLVMIGVHNLCVVANQRAEAGTLFCECEEPAEVTKGPWN